MVNASSEQAFFLQVLKKKNNILVLELYVFHWLICYCKPQTLIIFADTNIQQKSSV